MKHRNFTEMKDALQYVPIAKDRHALLNFNFRNHGQPASVKHLLGELGFGLEFRSLNNAVSAKLEPDTWSEKGFAITVNSNHHVLRQRFSALHEIAHYYLHSPDHDFLAPPKHRSLVGSNAFIYSAQETIEEKEANEWAESVIFGQRALEGAVGLFGLDLEALSFHFGFSIDVMQIALRKRELL